MNGLLSQRFEEGIQNICAGIGKKGGTKKLDKVHQRIGRLKQKYPSVHRYYDITVTDNGQGIATGVACAHKKGDDPDKKAGIYFLRTSLDEKQENTLWFIYNTIREIESTFRVLKSDLDLRPIYHKTDDASMAHLHLGLLAYWLEMCIRDSSIIGRLQHAAVQFLCRPGTYFPVDNNKMFPVDVYKRQGKLWLMKNIRLLPHPATCWMQTLGRLLPVSYTHLDVYKRQVQEECYLSMLEAEKRKQMM